MTVERTDIRFQCHTQHTVSQNVCQEIYLNFD